jgi:uncharacterized protein (DUF952 family)
MRLIDHIIPADQWAQVPPGPYRASSLHTEGFIHCSNRPQTLGVARTFFANHSELLVLVIDTGQLGDRLKDEDPGIGQTFPHVYGAIDRGAIVRIDHLKRDSAGNWAFLESW